jgi:hypothetical protein
MGERGRCVGRPEPADVAVVVLVLGAIALAA